jgi:hypothetical protein
MLRNGPVMLENENKLSLESYLKYNEIYIDNNRSMCYHTLINVTTYYFFVTIPQNSNKLVQNTKLIN